MNYLEKINKIQDLDDFFKLFSQKDDKKTELPVADEKVIAQDIDTVEFVVDKEIIGQDTSDVQDVMSDIHEEDIELGLELIFNKNNNKNIEDFDATYVACNLKIVHHYYNSDIISDSFDNVTVKIGDYGYVVLNVPSYNNFECLADNCGSHHGHYYL
ncbi:hypothetical protein HL033_02060 [Neoehrlichia mikurensis]|uniref:hypothetical protein n=1 Tax=Neoehrlichia mikurensis TaxID=89586 RepID=UPI001C4531CC|nr:hypothetical protein [Neoehrlichia mikurensis]QXK92314.1 hypothetical protein IAH97_02055 [Neoehrlichia mikurensis]QXK92768.1 hypothetical protein HUN61_02050 [Neoehrlichia mikurensis]QXK94009.1 hypothetical protein HL033_02060 [Neoehrlichia mikurensis]